MFHPPWRKELTHQRVSVSGSGLMEPPPPNPDADRFPILKAGPTELGEEPDRAHWCLAAFAWRRLEDRRGRASACTLGVTHRSDPMVNNGFIPIAAQTADGCECAGSVCVLRFRLGQLLRTFEILRQLREAAEGLLIRLRYGAPWWRLALQLT